MPIEPDVVIVTPGRFAVDLAVQLQTAGRLKALFSGHPRWKLSATRIRAELVRTCPWLQTSFEALVRLPRVPESVLGEVAWRAHEQVDRYAAARLPECRLVAAMSSTGLRAGTEAKRRGGVYVCDRGSTHIRWQDRILREEHAALGLRWPGVDPRIVDKEEAEYALADGIMLGSSFAKRTFVEMGVPAEKLHVAPYGANIDTFRRTAPRAPAFRVLSCGGATVRKGFHYVLQAFRKAGLPDAELVLVGPATRERDQSLRRYPVERLDLVGYVSRDEVVRQMSLASVLILPSVEEGLAAVQMQALACGCPILATPNTGSEDLIEDGRQGFIVPTRDVDALADRLTRLYRDRELVEAMGAAGVERMRSLGGWDEYGRTAIGVFDRLLAATGRRAAVQ